MKVIVTGTVGLDKGPYLDKVKSLAHEAGRELALVHVGRRMYAEAPDVGAGRILDLPLSRLSSLRRSVFKDILSQGHRWENLIINTHASFRWKHGLFPAFDFDQLQELNADLYICLLDNVDSLHVRLLREHQTDHSLKDLLVWREEETLATELMMMGSRVKQPSTSAGLFGDALVGGRPPARFYLLSRGNDGISPLMFYRLVFQPDMPRAYLSFPMTHVADEPEIQEEIRQFRQTMAKSFIVFDPSDLEEIKLCELALQASQQGHKGMEVSVLGQTVRFDVAEVLQAAGDIHAQIYARDFKLIDQADMIISYIPSLPDGKPGISSGVERELQHAHEATREVYVIWKPDVPPSPFVTETASRLFHSTEEALEYFRQAGKIR